MTRLKAAIQAVSQLSGEELIRFGRWFAEFGVEDGVAKVEARAEANEPPANAEKDSAAHDLLNSEEAVRQRQEWMEKAQEYGAPFVDLSRYRPEREAIALMPRHLAEQCHVLPLKLDGNTLYLATSNPNDLQAFDAIRLETRHVIRAVLAAPLDIRAAIAREYGESV